MPSERAEAPVDVREPRPGPHVAREELAVDREPERRIDAPPLQQVPAPEAGLLRDHRATRHGVVAVLGQDPVAAGPARRIEATPVAVDRVDRTVVGEVPGDEAKRPGGVHVVAIEPRDDLAGRALQPAPDRITEALVRTALEISQAVPVPVDDLERPVGRPALHDDVLEVRVLLL